MLGSTLRKEKRKSPAGAIPAATTDLQPVLDRVLADAEREEAELQEVYTLMGWGDLPWELRIEIRDDIRAFRQELAGRFSTLCPFVLNRRRRVDYWVRSYLAGWCSLETAVQALRNRTVQQDPTA